MLHHFDTELDGLKQKLLAMASHAETAINDAMRALLERNHYLAIQVKANDKVLDQFEIEIDDLAIHLLAKAPLASDLRLIIVAMKISQNVELVGDEAAKIANRAGDLTQEPPLEQSAAIPDMARLVVEMLKQSLDSFVNHDPAAARALIPRDKEVDSLNKQIHRELAHLMIADPEAITRCLNLMI